MKVPFIGAYVPKKDLEEVEQGNRSLQAMISDLRKDLAVAKRTIAKVLPKLMKITVYDLDPEFHTTRVCVDIRQDAMEAAFLRGNSDREIRFFARMLAETVEHKIVRFNILRKEGL